MKIAIEMTLIPIISILRIFGLLRHLKWNSQKNVKKILGKSSSRKIVC